MAQVSTTTSNVQNINTATFQSTINALRLKFVSGQPIYAADLNGIVGLYNTWITHDHTVTDSLYVAFGNIPAYPTTSETRTSGGVKNSSSQSNPASVGANITASVHNTVATGIINASHVRNHTHNILDKQLP